MEIEKVLDQAKNWIGTRLKNPYFGSVLAVWVVTNRKIIFGFFNFEENLSLDQRIDWVHQQLEGFTFLSFMWGFHGFEATVVWSFIIGFILMIGLNKISGIGEYLYKWSDKSTIKLVQKIEPANWVEKVLFEELQIKATIFEDDLKSKRTENNRLERENETAYDQLAKVKTEVNVLNKQLEEYQNQNTTYASQVKSNAGTIQELTEANNESASEKIALQQELDLVKLRFDLYDIFRGKWRSRFNVPAQNGKQAWDGTENNIQITPDMKYLVDSKHMFNIDMIDIDPQKKSVKFRKVSLDEKSTERITCDLEFLNSNELKGYEDNVTTGNNIKIFYSRI